MPEKAWERWNTHFDTCVEQELMGITLRLAQDPSSEHLGTTVWDASIVLAKYLEKNMRKGEFARNKVAGKKAIELGSGMGLAGLAMAMLGADVTLTDVKDVLPLLRRNYEQNLSPAALRAAGHDSRLPGPVGRLVVAELDWCDPRHVAALSPPYDLVLAADCIYHETLLRDLYRAVMALTNERSSVLIANERRSESVQSAFLDLFGSSFTMKKVPLAKQDPDYQHPAIELWLLKRKRGATTARLLQLEAQEAADLTTAMEALSMLAVGEDTAASTTGAAAGPAAAGEAAAGEGQGPSSGAVVAAAGPQAVSTRSDGAAAGSSAGPDGKGSTGHDATAAPAAVPAAVHTAGDAASGSDVDMMDVEAAASTASTSTADPQPGAKSDAAGGQQQLQQQLQGCCQHQQPPPLQSPASKLAQAQGSKDCGHGLRDDQAASSSGSLQSPGGVGALDPQAAAAPSSSSKPSGGRRSDRANKVSWATRREGAMAARLLADVQVPR